MFTKYVRKEDIEKVLETKEMMVMITIDDFHRPMPQFVNICKIPANSLKVDDMKEFLEKKLPDAYKCVNDLGWEERYFETLSITFWENCLMSEDERPENWTMFRIDVGTLYINDKDDVEFKMNYESDNLSDNPYEIFKTSVYAYR